MGCNADHAPGSSKEYRHIYNNYPADFSEINLQDIIEEQFDNQEGKHKANLNVV
ncbi:unnamed protein product, partial [marine sediment metagenome]